MPPLKGVRQLHLINGDKLDGNIKRHRLNRANPVARIIRRYFFLAGNQGHLFFANLGHHLAIDLTGQQTQRQAHHAAFVPDHPLNGFVGLTRIGRPEHGCHTARGCNAHCLTIMCWVDIHTPLIAQLGGKRTYLCSPFASLFLNQWNGRGTNSVRISDSQLFLVCFILNVVNHRFHAAKY